MNIKFIREIRSTDLISSRYDFQTENGYLEITKIQNENPPLRTILCCPVSYGCGLGCSFCHLTKAGSNTNFPIDWQTLKQAISMIETDPELPILISLMGAGEPLLNLELVKQVVKEYPTSLATSLPTNDSISKLIEYVSSSQSTNSLKIYVSVHSFIPNVRKQMMPNSTPHYLSWIRRLNNLPDLSNTLAHANKATNRLVLHYTLIPGVNNSIENLEAMIDFMKSIDTPPKIKFLKWSDGDNIVETKSWIKILTERGLPTSFHQPNASDVGGACGQFNPQYYC